MFRSLKFSQIANLGLATFLLLGIAATSYTVLNLRDSDAEAARRSTRPNAALSVSPNPISAYGLDYIISGSGFSPNEGVQLGQSIAGGCCSTFVVRADSEGKFSFSGVTEGPGTYKFMASVLNNRNKWIQVAETALIVE